MLVLESLNDIRAAGAEHVGPKAKCLAELAGRGFRVPPALCITAAAYEDYLSGTNLSGRVLFELGRKRFEDMRWEELWDAALRIRNLFLSTPLPAPLQDALGAAVVRVFGNRPVVVRSSAPGEDSGEASFAGLHESFVNVRGAADILKHVRLVWASLWSDAALLYRKELGLDVRRSRMAVLVQSLAEGECSGVAFSRSPHRADEALVEAVYGLNAGLVDGTVEPDRWTLERGTGRIVSHAGATRLHEMVSGASGIERRPLDPARAGVPPLAEPGVAEVHGLSMAAEAAFGAPQDVEWTQAGGGLTVLQSRPITTLSPEAAGGDRRAWYRSLSRTFENLQELRRRIQRDILPGMLNEASDFARVNPETLDNAALAREIERRAARVRHWTEVYWTDLIPFAHGVRLFGQYYNDVMQPANPYEFVDLLARRDFASVNRNEHLEALAACLRDDVRLRETFRAGGTLEAFPEFRERLGHFLGAFGDLSSPLTRKTERPGAGLSALLLEMAERPPRGRRLTEEDVGRRVAALMERVAPERRKQAEELLDLARASYQLRDDDNIYMHGIQAQLQAAVVEGKRRLLSRSVPGAEALTEGQVRAALAGQPIPEPEPEPEHSLETFRDGAASMPDPGMAAVQLVGQPSGPGLATGPARVVSCHGDLMGFRNGEVLVCDAISPTMTFVIPLASAVVERRGGMLIHGAIIAREYGIPCVTGVPDAVGAIRTGMRLTVDGYLGLVRIHAEPGSGPAATES